MRKCTKCGIEKPLTEFRMNGGHYRGECKICQQEKIKEINKANHTAAKNYVYSIKNCCVKCGENRKHLIDFHHLDGYTKENEISKILTQRYCIKTAKQKIDEEVRKCIQLCSNCHRDFHYLEMTQGTTIEEYLKNNVSDIV